MVHDMLQASFYSSAMVLLMLRVSSSFFASSPYSLLYFKIIASKSVESKGSGLASSCCRDVERTRLMLGTKTYDFSGLPVACSVSGGRLYLCGNSKALRPLS
ncbi:hypothetical protein F5Y15DRAFT_317678 [Xylariaceae sp. FL0016]|nr:hypothetical protein F5Y15DRAFT_317678 [Xylariaceae sp. FL0016]